ncbi:MAG: GGDEF domain-containing protein [Vulcanimicrobiaceae bacterium]
MKPFDRNRAHSQLIGLLFAGAMLGVVAVLVRGLGSWPAGLIALMLLATCATALIARCFVPIAGLRLRRTRTAAEIVPLTGTVVAPLVAYAGAEGAAAAACALFVGFCIAAIVRRRSGGALILRHGVMQTLVLFALIPVAGSIERWQLLGGLEGSLLFALALGVAMLTYQFLLAAPLLALQGGLRLGRVWSSTQQDVRFWIALFGGVLWATAVRYALSIDQPALAVAMWLPVIVVATMMVRIDALRVELHRLHLVRDAVHAMLGEREPVPQINAVLGSLHGPLVNETVSVFAATTARTEDWGVVASLGPEPSPAGVELRRRVLARLKFAGRQHTTLRDEYYAVHAYAILGGEHGDLLGALVVYRRPDAPANDHAQFEVAARGLAPLVRDLRSIAAARSAATTDALTGLKNRAASLEILRTVLGGKRAHEDTSVLLLDIDRFKSINDHLGHAAGDDCLREISRTIAGGVRAGDSAGRIGGEEFLVVMPSATPEMALMVGERVRAAVAMSSIRHADGEPVTVSVGAASAMPGDTPETLLARADAALYDAKRSGRNRVVESA